ncbi:transglycosylase [Leptospira perolatii]|uniref:Transglycosylase n=1 Tax=Leptospira perolatii TaxID=2023191 RepID=A0A2M9ZK06_9LEPT|nr:transglycosylase SLT domain-containing protein [Leptospira perolatii]PJZ69230.1 transglycosylase [Leptospira perolatii]PJZ72388.1 transglycosylase [Leptospira perolatii]
MKKTTVTVLLFIVVGNAYADADLKYLIKSYSLEKIRRIFRDRPARTESEVYALVKFHENHPQGDANAKYRYLVSILKGRMVASVSKEDLLEILRNPLPSSSAITKITFWKLYEEIGNHNSLSSSELISYLKKLPVDNEPIFRLSVAEILKIYYESGQYKEAKEYAESFSDRERSEYFGSLSNYRYAKALFKHGDTSKAESIFYSLMDDSKTPSYTKKDIYTDLRTWKGEGFYQSLPLDTAIHFIQFLSTGDRKSYISHHSHFSSHNFGNLEKFKAAARLLLQHDPEHIQALIQRNKSLAQADQDFAASLSRELCNQNLGSSALHILENLNLSNTDEVEYSYARAHKKLGNKDQYFSKLVSSLEKNPYNLTRQDELIDLLTENHSRFMGDAYWKEALRKIPNLPVKGRLVYWYMRNLKSSGRNEELYDWLKSYYRSIPGSYYTRVIREEFSSEISKIGISDYPLRNRDSLFQYLSLTAGDPKFATQILGRDMEFAYFPEAFQLDLRIDSAHSRIRGSRYLQSAKEYLEIGELGYGNLLVDRYKAASGIGEDEKEEILAALGEMTGNEYLTVYHTRSLMKKLRIPDDVILLPAKLASRIYPRPHRDLVFRYSNSFGIDEDIVYGIMRQESFFKENAVSISNARGLMQIMGPTGKGLAKTLGIGPYSLFDPETSIQMGARFLKYLLSSNSENLQWASIAYNGGPGNLRKWKRNHYKGDFNHFLEDLPVKEPRDYCRIVSSNYYNYQNLRHYKNR